MARTKRCKICGSTTGVNEYRRCPLCQASQDAVALGTTYGKMMAAREVKAARIEASSLVMEPVVRKCAWCGANFRALTDTEYCSPRCEAAAGDERCRDRDPGRPPRKCKICGELFVPWHGNQVTCSEECKLENLRRHHLNPSGAKFTPQERQCPGCGKMFIAHTGKQMYCNTVCWRRQYNAALRKKQAQERKAEGGA